MRNKVKIGVLVAVAAMSLFLYFKATTKPAAPQYQTVAAEKGTLIVSTTASGKVSSVNNTSVTTQATGVVSKIYVKDGDSVKAGAKIADINLDLIGKQKSTQALASYQSAKNAVATGLAKQFALQAAMFGKWETFMDLAQSDSYKDSSSPNRSLPQFHIPEKEWLAAEADYKNQQQIIGQAQTALSSAWLLYQQSSPTVYAPIAGTVSGFSLQVGSVITSSSSSTGTDTTSGVSGNKVASVITIANPVIGVSLSEIDVPKIHLNDKATVTFDAYADKTFTGKVVSIDMVGAVSSGVTTYPVAIQLDDQNATILPNMAATAHIITNVKDGVVLVPSSAVQSQSGSIETNSVRVMKNGIVQTVPVEVGLSSDTQTEITSGLSEGDEVVTSVIQQSTATAGTSGQTQSVFGGFGGGNRGFGGGGAGGGSGGAAGGGANRLQGR